MDRMHAEFEDLIPGKNSDSDEFADQNDVEQLDLLYKLLLDSGEYVVLLVERKTGRIKDLNIKAKRLLNIENSPEPKFLHEFFEKAEADRIHRFLSDESGSLSVTLHLQSRKDSPTINLVLLTLFPDPDGSILCLGHTNTDIRHNPPEPFRTNLLESVLETIPHPIFYKDTNGLFLGGNRYFLDDILGMSPDEIRGKDLVELENVSIDPYAVLMKKTDTEILKNGTPQNYQISIKTHSGQNKKFTVYKAPFRNTLSENAGLVGIMVDNTELYNTTKRALEGEEKLTEIFESITEIYFEASLDGEILFVSPSVEIITGYSKEELTGSSIYNFYESKEDRTMYLEALGKRGSLKDYLVKLKDKEGNIRDFLFNSRLIKDRDGNPLKISGIMRDVTENHRYQEALKASELKHRALLENAGAQIIYTNNSGDIILINRIAAKFIGQNPALLTGKNVTDIYASLHGPVLLKNINNVLLNRKGTLIETDVVDHGETLWFLINFQPVMDDEGHVNGIVIISNDITDRKKSESEMQKLSQAVEQSTSLIQIMDTSGKIEYVNPRFSEVTGYTFDEATGRYFDDLPLQKNRSHNYDTIREKLSQGETWEGEICDKRKDGSLIWLKTIISPVTNNDNEVINMIAVMEDITSRKKAEVKEIKIRQNLLLLNETALKILALPPEGNVFEIIGEQLSKICPDCLFAINSFNTETRQLTTEYIHSGNNFLEKFLRITAFSLRGTKYSLPDEVYDILISGNLEKIEGGLYEMLLGKVPENLCTQAEKFLNLESFYSRGIVHNDKLYGNVAIVNIKGRETVDQDLLSNLVTQASLGIERRNLEKELRLAKESAEEMNHLKSVFLANMSHELRTPLNGILGFSELLVENIEEERLKDMARVVNRSGNRLLDTLNTILDFSMIESRNVTLNYSDENITVLVGSIVNQFRQEAEKKELTLNFNPPRKTIHGYIVKDILRKIISQLLSNAIKFTNKGKVTLKLHTKSVRKYNFVHIDVIDTGQGIPEAEQKHIFEEFRQGSEGFSRRFEGTGLGLTICRKFTSMLNGDISVTSSPDKGSVFTLSIPLHTSDPNEQ